MLSTATASTSSTEFGVRAGLVARQPAAHPSDARGHHSAGSATLIDALVSARSASTSRRKSSPRAA